LADLAKKYGVDPKQIRLTPPVQNTDQEARAIAALMPQEQRRIVLVTSAFHMPRAQQVFAAQGLMIHPYPVDFRATYKQANLLDFFAHSRGLRRDVFMRSRNDRPFVL